MASQLSAWYLSAWRLDSSRIYFYFLWFFSRSWAYFQRFQFIWDSRAYLYRSFWVVVSGLQRGRPQAFSSFLSRLNRDLSFFSSQLIYCPWISSKYSFSLFLSSSNCFFISSSATVIFFIALDEKLISSTFSCSFIFFCYSIILALYSSASFFILSRILLWSSTHELTRLQFFLNSALAFYFYYFWAFLWRSAMIWFTQFTHASLTVETDSETFEDRIEAVSGRTEPALLRNQSNQRFRLRFIDIDLLWILIYFQFMVWRDGNIILPHRKVQSSLSTYFNNWSLPAAYNNILIIPTQMQATKTALALLTLTFLYTLLSLQSQRSPQTSFSTWKAQHSIKFPTEFEELYRKEIFYRNLAIIEAHNADPLRSYDMGVNQFTGLTQQEFVAIYLGTGSQVEVRDWRDEGKIQVGDVDWVSQGAVTLPKNQGQCGSCWAFSSTGSLQGLAKITHGTLKSFSEQQLIDCSGRYGNMGCNGGQMPNAFKYVKDNGICQDTYYPYRGSKQECKASSCLSLFRIASHTTISGCSDLANALASRPISVTVDATNWSSYSSGVFNKCGTSLNHGVVVVGSWGGIWKVKNSWGTVWGEHGFIRLAEGDTCGICRAGSYPTI